MEYWNHSVRQSGICNDILDEKAEEIRETKTTCSVEKWLRGVDRQEFLQWRAKAANPRHKQIEKMFHGNPRKEPCEKSGSQRRHWGSCLNKG